MLNIDLNKISNLISIKLNKKTHINSIESIGSGYHSNGYKLNSNEGTSYFLKHVHSHDLGYEFPERQIMSLMVSDSMSKRLNHKPQTVGVSLNSNLILPDILDVNEIFHIQEYTDLGKSYSEILKSNENKLTIDEEDIDYLNLVADKLIKIHSVKHESNDKQQLDAIYNDGIRNVLTHPELSMMVISEFPEDYEILNIKEQQEFISLMYKNIKKWMYKSDRLCALHGDFWGSNIFINNNKDVSVIDFSRIPWGDPGIDVGWFLTEFIWNYHQTGNTYYRELAEKWLDVYEEKSGDTEIRKAVVLSLGWVGIVRIYPKWFPELDVNLGKNFISHIKEILEKGEFIWKD
jgi:thiamine kinase-like enzyme